MSDDLNETLRALVYEAWERRAEMEPKRGYLGASGIGAECARAVWYDWRDATHIAFPGRVLRMFDRGRREEDTVYNELHEIGFTVHDVDPATGQQYAIRAFGGMFQGHTDGQVSHPRITGGAEWLLEIKTASRKRWMELQKSRDLQHWAQAYYWQVQAYMDARDLPHCLFVCVCKDDDELLYLVIDRDPAVADQIWERIERVLFEPDPPTQIADKPGTFACRFCRHEPVCWRGQAPALSCRSCAWADVDRDALQWTCQLGRMWGTLCEQHVIMPAMQAGAELTGGDVETGALTFRAADGSTYTLGGPDGLRSIDAQRLLPWLPGHVPQEPF
jgi:hypothetical protein